MYTSKQRYKLIAAIIFLSLALSGCDSLTDCIDNDGPELSPGTLPNPILNQEYDQVVHVGIRNEPNDDRFNYEFTLSGGLPEGMQTSAAGRDMRIFGTPIELGDFNLNVTVEVVERSLSGTQTEGLCSTIDRINYQWAVQVM
ncbi:MAG: hypothetical protein V3U65_17600 [Granulosicoccaceae bacterium]